MTQLPHFDSTRPTVLLVDDDEDTLEETSGYLAQEGFRVMKQSSPFGVTNLVRRHRPDVVVLDVMMPGLDGGGLGSLIRGEADVPIIFFSATQEEYLRDLVMRTERAMYVLKSEGFSFLADEIRKAVRKGARESR